jgi:predicted alpha/beta hydrolase family esterase
MTDATDRGYTRRRLVSLVASGVALGLAGCGEQTEPTTPNSSEPEPPEETPTENPPEETPTDDALRDTARRFVQRLADEEFEAAREPFAPVVAEQVSAATLAGIWADLQRASGTFVRIEGTERTTVQSSAAVVATVQFSRARQGIRLVFDDDGLVAGFQLVAPASEDWTAPAYVDQTSIETTETQISVSDSCSLPAEVTVPVESEATTGFVLLGGSGPTDLNGTVGPNQPYRDLAYGLGTAGTASLRYTKRTAVCDLDPATLTIDDEYTEDAVDAVETLRSNADVDQTIVMGHSLGAKLAPRVATRLDDVAGLVLLAPPGRPLPELVVEQTRYLAELDGTVTDDEQSRIDAVAAAADRIERLDLSAGDVILGAGRPYWESLQESDAFETAGAGELPTLV